MVTHYARGPMVRLRGKRAYAVHCLPVKLYDPADDEVTYSLDSITCPTCLEAYIRIKERELNKARQYLHILTHVMAMLIIVSCSTPNKDDDFMDPKTENENFRILLNEKEKKK